jgi:hypothetical protein
MCEYETKEFLAFFFFDYIGNQLSRLKEIIIICIFFFEKVTGVVRKVMNKIKYNDEETEKG